MPIITKLVAQGKHPDRANLYLDGEFFCAISKITAVQNRLRVGMEIEEGRLREIVFESDKEGAFGYALQYIAQYAPTVRQMRDKLYAKGYGAQVVSYVIDKAQSYGYLNDAEWARSYVALSAGVKGERRLRADMAAKGIRAADADQALEGMTFAEGALELARKHARGQDLQDPKYRAKLSRYLAYRGFGWDEIGDCIRVLEREAKDDVLR